MAPLIREYFKLTEQYKNEYGEKSILLMQVGAFFEVYGLQDKKGNIFGSNIKEFCEHCDLASPLKNVKLDSNNVIMSGFRDYQLEKYLNKLQEIGYTTIVYTQDVQAANTTRSLAGIYSPGTYFSNDTKNISNNTLCIWLYLETQNVNKETNIHVGLANVDVYTGKTNVFEFSNEYQHNPATYDELERFVSICNPSEVIIISEMEDRIIDDIIIFAGIQCQCIHKMSSKQESKMAECIRNCEKQVYQMEIMKRFYKNQAIFFEHFHRYQLATQAFCFLLDYIYQHNPNLVHRLSIPVFENCSNRLILANHSLKQLNIIDDNHFRGKMSSVSKFLNNCVTSMGKRRFAYELLNPMNDVNKLEKSYTITEHTIKKATWDKFRTELETICDIEKLRRKLILKKITPKNFYMLHHDLKHTKKLFQFVAKDKKLLNYLNLENIVEDCDFLIDVLENNFEIMNCKDIDTLLFDKALHGSDFFVKKGADSNIDDKLRNNIDSQDQLNCIKDKLNQLLNKFEKKAIEPVKLHQTASLGISLITTQRRGKILQTQIGGLLTSHLQLKYNSKFSEQEESLLFDIATLEFNKFSSTNKNTIITNDQIKNICNDIRVSKDKLLCELNRFYNEFISTFITYEERLINIINFISQLDVLHGKCYNAVKFNYCKPTIQKKSKKSFIEATAIRHVLIEHLQTQEIYVANDIQLGNDKDGVLLYGTNAVGKTSFIKSLGIAVIMAQAGMYVPCSSFLYYPYEYIFTRILGNDNIFKGLSTFAVEMSELRTILKLANKNSLILGDELCSGTESDSARSIFMAGLEDLHKKECSFIFATHFHEITNYDELKALTNMSLKHMTVMYNKEKKLLVYDRKLKDGPGDNMYGLEVCKALNLPNDFLIRAHDIRMKYNPQNKNILSMNTSSFNKKKVKGTCEMCETNMGEDIHHLQYQNKADEFNFIGSFHKNHLANLVNICKDCHNKIHKDKVEYKKQKTDEGYIFTPISHNSHN
jgi:DNA mismatch repair protein MutS